MKECNKCKNYGLIFKRNYSPDEFLEGKTNSKIWIIGLNPAAEIEWEDPGRDVKELSFAMKDRSKLSSYFKNFEKVSSELYSMFGEEYGVAHTDLVKCSSKKWPPDSCKGKKAKVVIDNCKSYLFEQIEKYKPKMIICNGAPVSHEIEKVLESYKKISDTAYESMINETKVIVILSGFIGRIDNFSRRRLGYEIESLMKLI